MNDVIYRQAVLDEVHLNVKVKPVFMSEIHGSMCIELGKDNG